MKIDWRSWKIWGAPAAAALALCIINAGYYFNAGIHFVMPIGAALGFPYAQMRVGEFYQYDQEANYEEAMKWYRKAADQGNAEAQYQLGEIYDQGMAGKKDYQEAFKWFRLAAEQGEPDAQLNLGDLYESGQGVKQDYAEAYFWENLGIKSGAVLIDDSRGERKRRWALRLSSEQRAAIEKRVKEWKPVGVLIAAPGPAASPLP